MAIRYAITDGNWSNNSTWDGASSIPGPGDDVYSNGFTVTIDTTPITVSYMNNGPNAGVPSAGGSFILSNGVTLTSTNGINGGIGYIGCIISSVSTSASINANVTSTGGDTAIGVRHTGVGTLNIVGNITGGSGHGNSAGVRNESSGTPNVSGNITGGTDATGLINQSSGAVNITGSNVTATNASAISNTSSGIVVITASVSSTGPGNGVVNSAGGTINITGTCTGGTSTGTAFVNSSSGTINHIGTAQASTTSPAIGHGSASQVTILTGPLLCTSDTLLGPSASGVNPCVALRWFPKDTTLSTFYYQIKAENVVSSAREDRKLYFIDAYSSSYPAVSNVRYPITYGPSGIYTGTCNIPPRESVSFGVGVGTTTGIAVFNAESIWGVLPSSITTPGSIGERLKTIATVNTVSQQISDAFSAK